MLLNRSSSAVVLLLAVTACRPTPGGTREAGTPTASRSLDRLWSATPDPMALGRDDLRRREEVPALIERGDWATVLDRIAWWEPSEISEVLPNTPEARAFLRQYPALAFEPYAFNILARRTAPDPLPVAEQAPYCASASPHGRRGGLPAVLATIAVQPESPHCDLALWEESFRDGANSIDGVRAMIAHYPSSPYLLPMLLVFFDQAYWSRGGIPDHEQTAIQLLTSARDAVRDAARRLQILIMLARILQSSSAASSGPLRAATLEAIRPLDLTGSWSRALLLRSLLKDVRDARVDPARRLFPAIRRQLAELELVAPPPPELWLGWLAILQLDPTKTSETDVRRWSREPYGAAVQPAALLTLAFAEGTPANEKVRLLELVAHSGDSLTRPFGCWYLAGLQHDAGDEAGMQASLSEAIALAEQRASADLRNDKLFGMILDSGIEALVPYYVARGDCARAADLRRRWRPFRECGLSGIASQEAMDQTLSKCQAGQARP